MPGFIAKKLCPSLIFLPCNFEKYEEVARIIRKIIEEYDPEFTSISLDEVYFDITNFSKQKLKETSKNNDIWSIASEIIEEIRERIKKATGGLTSSAGISCNTMLAKICSNLNKPNGQYILPPSRDEIMNFMNSLPTRKVPGIGKVLETVLESLDIRTMGDVKENIWKILAVFSQKTSYFLASACIGICCDNNENENGTQKSVGRSQTFSTLRNHADQIIKLKEICSDLFEEISDKQLSAQCVTLKLKTDKFKEISRSKTFSFTIKSLSQLEEICCNLLAAEQPITVRLIGVTLSKLKSKNCEDNSFLNFFKQSKKEETDNQNSNKEKINDSDDNSSYIFEDYTEIIDNENQDNINDIELNHVYKNDKNITSIKVDSNNNFNSNKENSTKKRRESENCNNIIEAFKKKNKKENCTNDPWICLTCTYNHCTNEERKFLACAICLEPKPAN